jgi:hypothetical protein
MVLKLLGIALRDADHKSEVPPKPSLRSREGILDDNRSGWLAFPSIRRREVINLAAFKTAVQFWLEVTTAILNPRWRNWWMSSTLPCNAT